MNQTATPSVMAPPDSWTLGYDSGRHLIRLHRPPAGPPAAAGPVYEQLIRLARRNNCCRWLLDNRDADGQHLAFLHWLVCDFLPQATARLAPRRLRLAVLSGPGGIAALPHDAALTPVCTALRSLRQPLEGQYFLNEGAAVAWLLARPD